MQRDNDIAFWIRRWLVPERFRPMLLSCRDGTRLEVHRAKDMQVDTARGTIRVAIGGGWHRVLIEDVMTVGLRPRPKTPRV